MLLKFKDNLTSNTAIISKHKLGCVCIAIASYIVCNTSSVCIISLYIATIQNHAVSIGDQPIDYASNMKELSIM